MFAQILYVIIYLFLKMGLTLKKYIYCKLILNLVIIRNEDDNGSWSHYSAKSSYVFRIVFFNLNNDDKKCKQNSTVN